jgi:hypothetical protein
VLTILAYLLYSIEYNKKKDKKATIKFVKDETVRGEGNYKSATVSVSSGEPPNSGEQPDLPISVENHHWMKLMPT